VIVAVVSCGAAQDPELGFVEGSCGTVHWVHLRDLLPFVDHPGHKLPAVGIGSPESIITDAD